MNNTCKSIVAMLLLAVLVLGMMPGHASADYLGAGDYAELSSPITVRVIADRLGIRTRPWIAGALVGSYLMDDCVDISATWDGWGETEHGWINLRYVVQTSKTPYAPGYNTDKEFIIITRQGASVYDSPNKNSAVVGSYSHGEQVGLKEIDSTRTWCRTEKGWIPRGDVYIEGAKIDEIKAKVTEGISSVYAGPSRDTERLENLAVGEKITILCVLRVNGGRFGYIGGRGWINMDNVKEI